jgi:hypothetical protein
MIFTEHREATCPDCFAPLCYGLKQEPNGWKVYYECGEQCGFERMVCWVRMTDVAHRDETEEQVHGMGDRWT